MIRFTLINFSVQILLLSSTDSFIDRELVNNALN